MAHQALGHPWSSITTYNINNDRSWGIKGLQHRLSTGQKPDKVITL